MTTEVVAVTASGAFVVNGPEDSPDGDRGIYIRWRDAEENVARLGQRIFKQRRSVTSRNPGVCRKAGLPRSLSNTLVSVRQVAQRNTGRRTAGIDGEVALTLPAVAKLATDVHQTDGAGGPCRSSGCTSLRRGTKPSCARWVFLCSWTVVIRHVFGTHWSPSGKPGSSLDPMGSDQAAVVRTRSRPSSTRCAAQPLDGCGFWTRTWKRRSIESITTSYLASSGRSRRGDSSRTGSRPG